MAEQARKEAELEAARQAEEERLRKIAEMKALREKEKREGAEHVIRCEQLQLSCSYIRGLIEFNLQLAMQEKREHEVSCWKRCRTVALW